MLSTVFINETSKWNNIVKSFNYYEPYYLAEYLEALKFHGDGEPILFYYESEGIRALNVAMKRDIAADKNFAGELYENTYFDIATPYGYGGFIIEGKSTMENMAKIDEEFSKYCKDNNIITEFVRINPLGKGFEYYTRTYECSKMGITVFIELSPAVDIFNNMTSKCRNIVRKAEKNGVYIAKDENLNTLEQFKIIYKETMERDNAKQYYYFGKEYYNYLALLKGENVVLYNALYDNKIISSAMVLLGKENAHYHLGGLLNDFMKLGANNLLLYETACDLSSLGFKKFHLGGGVGSQNDGLLSYKKKFNKNGMLDYYIAKKVFLPDIYKRLIDIRKDSIMSEYGLKDKTNINAVNDYFPEYRAEFFDTGD